MITMYVVEKIVLKSTNKGWTQSTFHDVIADYLTIWVIWQFSKYVPIWVVIRSYVGELWMICEIY